MPQLSDFRDSLSCWGSTSPKSEACQHPKRQLYYPSARSYEQVTHQRWVLGTKVFSPPGAWASNILSPQTRPTDFLCRGPENNHFQHWGILGLCHLYPGLLLWHKSSHRHAETNGHGCSYFSTFCEWTNFNFVWFSYVTKQSSSFEVFPIIYTGKNIFCHAILKHTHSMTAVFGRKPHIPLLVFWVRLFLRIFIFFSP